MVLLRSLSLAAVIALLAGSVAAGVLAGGARHASATFVDAAGNTIGWAKLVEDGTGRVHVSIHVDGLASAVRPIEVTASNA